MKRSRQSTSRTGAAGGRTDPALLHVRVQPRASRNEVRGWQGDVLRVRVTAAPTEGQANRAVVELLADAVGLSPSSIQLVGGDRSRDKLFRVGSLSAAAVRARLGGAAVKPDSPAPGPSRPDRDRSGRW